jgi:hypothetical protein
MAMPIQDYDHCRRVKKKPGCDPEFGKHPPGKIKMDLALPIQPKRKTESRRSPSEE